MARSLRWLGDVQSRCAGGHDAASGRWKTAASAVGLWLVFGCGDASETAALGAVDATNGSAVLDAGERADAAPDGGGPTEGGASGVSDGGQSTGRCVDLDPEACAQRGDCVSDRCPGCPGEDGFPICRAAGQMRSCPVLLCVEHDCPELTEEQCDVRADCQIQTCSGCGGSYRRCVAAEGPPSCPRPDCSCGRFRADEAGCIVSPDCHAVYDDWTHDCGCEGPDCACYAFRGCTDGPANCGGVDPDLPVCTAEPPECAADFLTVGYAGQCFEGCVRLDECGP